MITFVLAFRGRFSLMRLSLFPAQIIKYEKDTDNKPIAGVDGGY